MQRPSQDGAALAAAVCIAGNGGKRNRGHRRATVASDRSRTDGYIDKDSKNSKEGPHTRAYTVTLGIKYGHEAYASMGIREQERTCGSTSERQ